MSATYIWVKEVDKDAERKSMENPPERVRHVLDQEIKDYDDLQEIKLRTGQPLLIRCLGEEKIPGGDIPIL